MSLPREPRQKMINMMYLVLTALLALNVSKEIINAFVKVNESLEVSKTNIDNKNKRTYESFKQLMQNDAKKYGDVNAKAQDVKKASDVMVKYLQDLKDEFNEMLEALERRGAVTLKQPGAPKGQEQAVSA